MDYITKFLEKIINQTSKNKFRIKIEKRNYNIDNFDWYYLPKKGFKRESIKKILWRIYFTEKSCVYFRIVYHVEKMKILEYDIEVSMKHNIYDFPKIIQDWIKKKK